MVLGSLPHANVEQPRISALGIEICQALLRSKRIFSKLFNLNIARK